MTREEILPIAKPILFNTEMVGAILDDRKTATRRKVEFLKGKNPNWTGYVKDGMMLYNGTNEPCIKPSRYKVGDYLYVRETWSFWPCWDCDVDCNACCTSWNNTDGCFVYRTQKNKAPYDEKWSPSIHMPKEAARIFLRVTDVGVERLRDIGDCTKEGIEPGGHATAHMNDYDESCAFKQLWDSTIKRTDLYRYGWDANPWVWVIEFERVEV